MRITRRFTIIATPVWSTVASIACAVAADARPSSAAQIDLDRAKAEGKVVIYTSLDTQIVDAMNKVFSAKYGIAVQYFRGGPGDVTSKILAEADAGRPQADIVDAGDLASVLLMKERGLLSPFRSDAESVIPPHLRDADGTWITNRLTQAIIHYNTKEFGSAPPQHWADLTRSGFNGRLVYSSASNGDHAPRLVTMADAFGWDLLKKLAATKPLRMQSPQLTTQVIERGERGGVLPAERQSCAPLQGRRPAHRFCVSQRRRAARDRGQCPFAQCDASARRRPVSRMAHEPGGTGVAGQRRQIFRAFGHAAARGLSAAVQPEAAQSRLRALQEEPRQKS